MVYFLQVTKKNNFAMKEEGDSDMSAAASDSDFDEDDDPDKIEVPGIIQATV